VWELCDALYEGELTHLRHIGMMEIQDTGRLTVTLEGVSVRVGTGVCKTQNWSICLGGVFLLNYSFTWESMSVALATMLKLIVKHAEL